jgi:hypothetical protein
MSKVVDFKVIRVCGDIPNKISLTGQTSTHLLLSGITNEWQRSKASNQNSQCGNRPGQ